MTASYTNRDAAIDNEVVRRLGNFTSGDVDDFDIFAIADEVIAEDENGYYFNAGEDEFWDIAGDYHYGELTWD